MLLYVFQIAFANTSNYYELVPIKSGTYTLGATQQTHSHRRSVKLNRDVLIMTTEVTKELWYEVTRQRKGTFQKCQKNCPVQEVSWFDAVQFANEFSEYSDLDPCYIITENHITWNRSCTGFRLPTEDEWEVAAADGYTYSGGHAIHDVSWNLFNANRSIHPVASKSPNKNGLFDMSGNVWEWVWEGRGTSSQTVSTKVRQRIRKGGSWSSGPNASEVFFRGYFDTQLHNPSVGLRLVRTASERVSEK